MISTPEKSDISKMPHKLNSAKYMHIKKGKPETYIHSLEIVQSSFCFFYKSTSPNRLWKISPPDNREHESNQNIFEIENRWMHRTNYEWLSSWNRMHTRDIVAWPTGTRTPKPTSSGMTIAMMCPKAKAPWTTGGPTSNRRKNNKASMIANTEAQIIAQNCRSLKPK